MQPVLDDLINSARQAGAIIRAGYEQDHQVMMKGEIDLVTEMDRRVEDFLLSAISARFPGHTIITEESGLHPGASDHCWYIDPIDGTVNYAHHLPWFVVSLAYAEAGQMKYGTIYEPLRDECFSAARGQGAWLNDRPIRVSSTSALIAALFSTGFPYDVATAQNNNVAQFVNLTKLSQGVRRSGSAALDMAYVGCGRLDGFWELQLQPWDIAAGALIVKEAGGVVTNVHGSRDLMQPPFSIAVSNPRLHPLFLAALNGSPDHQD
ncbi:MAG TPA: inositol monophosphatase family protein [Levilinea sp.]|nr:inositol monophosphatase family protein [Levilinea sp.]